MKNLHKWYLIALLFLSGNVFATDYHFFISSAVDPAFANRTLADDQANEFEAASKLVSTYLAARSIIAEATMLKDDYIYVTYKDGQIGKFKIVSLRDSIKVRFDGQVQAVPRGATKLGLSDPGSVLSEYHFAMRDDYSAGLNLMIFTENRIKIPTVTIIQNLQDIVPYAVISYEYPAGGGGCAQERGGNCSNPTEQ
jgi:hypothetical protein